MHGQLASPSDAGDDWNDTEVGEESEIDSQHDLQECRTSPTKPRWLDEQTEIPKEEYEKSHALITKEPRDMFEYRVSLPRRSPNCGMTTIFGDLCDELCYFLRRAPSVGERRRQCRREPASAPAVGGSSNSGAHQKKGHLVKRHRLTIKSSATVAAANDPCISSGSDLGMPQQVISQHEGEMVVTSRPLRTAHVRAKGPPPKETLEYAEDNHAPR